MTFYIFIAKVIYFNVLKIYVCRIHKEQIDKWQEEIKELRLLDASNEEASAVLHNARFLLQSPPIDT